MALLGGIGGGVSRDVIVNRVPAAFTNSSYIALCLIAGVIGYLIAYDKGPLFREGLFQFVTSFALPW
ncbi:TRIC cation channel family protein [Streptodolium elevatio]|uniref:TRIC cation channel family protein n=1 Tax=Streptodolium elevatio TaxID=3157996 RepID=A0ABV3DET4_9ACTN